MTSEQKAEIGARRRSMREARGLKPIRLAADANVTMTTVYRAEGGEDLKLSTLQALAGALGVPLADYAEPAAATPAPRRRAAAG